MKLLFYDKEIDSNYHNPFMIAENGMEYKFSKYDNNFAFAIPNNHEILDLDVNICEYE